MAPDPLIGALDQTAETLAGLPWAVHALVAAGGIAGVVLWLAGRRVLKPTIIVLFALAGAAAAVTFAPPLSIAAEVSPELTWGAVGLVVGGVMGVLLFRFAMAVALGTVLGLAAPLGAAIALEVTPADPDEQRIAEVWRAVGPHWWNPDDEGGPETIEPAAPRGSPMGSVAAAAGEELDAQWRLVPGQSQAVLAVSTVAGAMLGILLGLLTPVWASGAVSALLGPAVWLPSGVWLASAFSLPGRQHLERSPAEWLIVWGALAAVGLAVQWSGLLRGSRRQRAGQAA